MAKRPTSAQTSAVSSQYHRIVVGIDGSDGAQRALDWAARQAALTGAALEIHAVHSTQYEFATRSDIESAMGRLLEHAVSHVQDLAPDVTVAPVSHFGAPATVLVEAAKDADLLVVGSRGLGGFSGLFLGSVSHRCAVHAPCPVVVIRPSSPEAPGTDRWPPERIVVGIDGSDPSVQALGWALGEAELTKARVMAVISWRWPDSFGWGMPLPADIDMAGDAEALLHSVVDPVRQRYPSVAVGLDVVSGHPALVLVEASRSADLLVVGSRGRGELMGAMLGSVSEHCVSHAGCPVVVLRGPDQH